MNQIPGELPDMPFPVRQISICSVAMLPLAEARNEGMAASFYKRIVFLDVDCIPAPNMLTIYGEQWDDNQLLSGQVRYLPALAAGKAYDQENLHAHSIADPLRSGLAELPYELFWSLNFGSSKTLFALIGGFDVGFQGYGAEDTDFAFAARQKNVPVKNIQATAYHQYHESYSPPLNHLSDIIANANRFYIKWKKWPMEGWLLKFEEAGLISRTGTNIQLLRKPTHVEIQLALKI
ncbi:glycosyltransferase family 2 protein [Mucilaginibacter terrae]